MAPAAEAARAAVVRAESRVLWHQTVVDQQLKHIFARAARKQVMHKLRARRAHMRAGVGAVQRSPLGALVKHVAKERQREPRCVAVLDVFEVHRGHVGAQQPVALRGERERRRLARQRKRKGVLAVVQGAVHGVRHSRGPAPGHLVSVRAQACVALRRLVPRPKLPTTQSVRYIHIHTRPQHTPQCRWTSRAPQSACSASVQPPARASWRQRSCFRPTCSTP